jgi:glycosyltransferase involved in cell wall biosynthesis
MSVGFVLNFIMRNEEHVLQRMFDSVKHFVEAVIVVDTGSIDRSKEIVNSWNLPVIVIDNEWKDDFAHSRNVALLYAYRWAHEHPEKTWYALFMDADNEAHPTPNFVIPTEPQPDAWIVEMRNNDVSYDYLWMVKLNFQTPWAWFYPLHEVCQPAKTENNDFVMDSRKASYGRLKGIWINSGRDGTRNKNPKKYLDDVSILEKWIKEHPNDLRCNYYLGQSWLDAGYPIMAEAIYDNMLRADNVGDLMFIAALRSGMIKMFRDLDPEKPLMRAREISPHRREPLYYLAKYWQSKGMKQMAKDMIEKALSLKLIDGIVFLDKTIWEDKVQQLAKELGM